MNEFNRSSVVVLVRHHATHTVNEDRVKTNERIDKLLSTDMCFN